MATITSLPAASTIDPVNDFIAIDTASVTTTQKITRNTYLGLASAPVGLTDTQTLTNKILTSPTLNTPTISTPTLSGTISGTYTIGGTPTFPSSVVTLTGTQTLTNKTLTSPTLTNATITADAISGFTVSNNGTIYGVSITGGQIAAAALGAFWPVGSIYSETTGTNPGTTFGFGTWAAFGGGRVLVGNGTSDQTFTAGATGGESSHVLTIPEMPSHTHSQTFTSATGAIAAGSVVGNNTGSNTGSTGGGGAHNNLQPYIVVYFWKRTA